MDHKQIIKRLQRAQFEAYTVGGCVRDQIMGITPDDYDVVTLARPEQVHAIFRDRNVKEVGKTFGVMIVDDIEVATFRHDNYNENDLTVTFADSIFEDLERRDLTINALAYDVENDEIFGNSIGLDDIKNKIIRFVGNPAKRITEDPCRILRACRFLAKIDGEFSPATFTALNEAVVWYNKLEDIAPERIRLEILKAMKIKNASKFFLALHRIGALEHILPSLASCWDHEHGNHHVENVWDHCMLAGDHISTKNPLLKLAGYLHDCGKPRAFNSETKQFLRHEAIGSTLSNIELLTLRFSFDEVKFVSKLIKNHMWSTQKMSNKATRKFLKRLNEDGVNIDDFFRIRMADRAANIGCDPFKLSEWVSMIKNVKNPAVVDIPFNVKQLNIKGGEIIKELNLHPGPIVSKIQNHLLDFVIERGPSHNNRELLILVAKNFIVEC